MNETFQHRNLPLLLAQVRENVISNFRPLLHHFGLTDQQWRVLRVLAEAEGMEPRDLCEICQILSPSMAGILKRLEEMGLVKRDPVSGDKRRVLVSTTPASDQLIQQMAPLVQQQYLLLEEAWGKDLIDQLYRLLDDVMALKDVPGKRIDLPDPNKAP